MTSERIDRLRQDFKSGTVIAHAYPITLINGAVVTDVIAECGKCNTELPKEFFRGVVSTMHGGNTIINRGVGCCAKCLLIFEVENRIKTHKDGYRVEWCKDGHWVTSIYEVETRRSRFVSAFKRFFNIRMFG